MINTEQDNYAHVLTDVTKHITLIIKHTNGLNHRNQDEDLNTKANGRPEELTFKKLTITKELNPVKDNVRESVIYDKVSDEYTSRLNIDDHKNKAVLYMKQKALTLNEKLKKTQPVWYLPNLSTDQIIERLRKQKLGNFILTTGTTNIPKSVDLIENLKLYFVIQTNTIDDFLIEHKNKKFYFKLHPNAKFDAIIPLLEHYITERPLVGNLKLSLPNSINNAVCLTQLHSLSLLEQDFWNKELQNSENESKLPLNSIYSSTPFINTTNRTIKQLSTESKQISFSSSLIQIPAVRISQTDNNNNHHNYHPNCFTSTNSSSKYVRRLIKNSQNLLFDNALTKNNNKQNNLLKQQKTELVQQAHYNSSCNNNNNSKSSIITSSNRLFKKRFHSRSLDQLDTLNENKNTNLLTKIKPKIRKKRVKIKKEKTIQIKKNSKDLLIVQPVELLSSSSLLPSSSISFQSSSSTSFKSFTASPNKILPASTSPDLASIEDKSTNLFKWPHRFLTKKFRSNLTIGENCKTSCNNIKTAKSDEIDLQKHRSTKSNTRSIADFFIGLISKNKSNLEEALSTLKETDEKKQPKRRSKFFQSFIKSNKKSSSNSTTQMILDNNMKQKTDVPKLPYTAPPSLNSNKLKILEEHYSNSSMFYSSYPGLKGAQQSDFIKRPTKKIERFSNEYSEPFDYLLERGQQSAQSTLTKTKVNSNNNNKDDSGYSSSYVSQSSQSTPRIYNKIWESSSKPSEEDISTSSSPVLLVQSPNESLLYKHSTPLLLNKKQPQQNQNDKPVLSEYESVKDSLIKYERRLDLQNSFKSTITAFDVLSDRCAELICLFESENDQQPKRSTNKNNNNNNTLVSTKHETLSRKKNVITSIESKYTNNSRFLDRTLSFNNFMSSSVLLTSFNENLLGDDSLLVDKKLKNFSAIRSYIFKLAKNSKSIFGKSISEFISCSVNSKEANPNVLMSNTRQFMNGMKNYLMNKNDLSNLDLKNLIEKERENLDQTEILNIDWILEDCLQSIVLRPLKAKIYYLIVDWLINDGSLVGMNKNIKLLNSLDDLKCVEYLRIARVEHKPTSETLNLLRNYYNRMQCEYAPLIKLKYILYMMNELLSASSESIGSVSNNDFYLALQDVSFLNVVEFLPILIYSLCKCNMSAIQIEIEYIWSLVNRQLLNNECVYYLTLMSSACHVLKNFDLNQIKEEKLLDASQKIAKLKNASSSLLTTSLIVSTTQLTSSSRSGLSFMEIGLIEIYLIDNFKTIKIKTIPVRPNSKCKEVNSLIASKFKVFNSEDYALYYIENSLEKKLRDDDQPLEIKMERFKDGINVKFIYKQKLANIITKYY